MYEYFRITANELGENSKIPLLKLGDNSEVFYELALEMTNTIKKNNKEGKKSVFICPVGPTGQYPIFVRMVNREQISLKNCWFINMDEYLNDEGTWISEDHPLSFRGFMNRNVYGRVKADLLMPLNQRIFPNPAHLEDIPQLIEKLGGVDIAFGGIGINGHIAFNEPQDTLGVEDYAKLRSRVLDISCETRTINGANSLSGAIDAMPRKCVTIGMAEILQARAIRLAAFRDWHRAVVRQAAYGEVSAHFPATLIQLHSDAKILVSENATQMPF